MFKCRTCEHHENQGQLHIYIYIHTHTHNHIYVYIYIYSMNVYIYLYHIMLGFQALKKHNWLCSWYSLFVETPQRVRGSRRVLALPRPSADCDWVYPKSWRFFWWKVPQTKWMSWRYPMTWETLQYIIYIMHMDRGRSSASKIYGVVPKGRRNNYSTFDYPCILFQSLWMWAKHLTLCTLHNWPFWDIYLLLIKHGNQKSTMRWCSH